MDESRSLFEGNVAGKRHHSGDAPGYVYEPLPKPSKDGDHYIRLIFIKPGKDTDDIICTLKPANLGLKPKYETLSYVWGPPDRTAKVICDGEYLGITNTLLKIVQKLRLKDDDRVFWIDQLCINQDDKDERDSQVKIMDKIYQGSSSTTAFLYSTEGNQSSDNPEPSLHSLHLIRLLLSYNFSVLFAGSRLPIFRSLEGDPSVILVRELFANPWFSRIWIVQEFCVSKNITLLFRNRIIPMRTFVLGSILMSFLPTQQKALGSSDRVFVDSRVPITECMQHLVLLRLRLSSVMPTLPWSASQSGWTICDLLRETRLSRATDPKDKIFAMVTLLEHLTTTGHGKTVLRQ
jgi:hypothetical protein